ncbi:hypothetical protein QAD02_018603 [Eretmocerus hayati]|uniref:Uncharacterized protein n=1 Tax=Eretmocerus hayati TaxID=131215 RepID=A0ACC2PJ05_9HYME|nr:hypothetical protein QAD02_018603 [Eretmocerus hayati]
MWPSIVFAFLLAVLAQPQGIISIRSDLACFGRAHHNVTLTAYYPDFSSDNESDFSDSMGKKLRTLQDFLDGRGEYVTVAMDDMPNLPYGSIICVPELNEHFGRAIPLQVRDYGVNVARMGYSRLDVCVRSEADSYDNAVNRLVTVYTRS